MIGTVDVTVQAAKPDFPLSPFCAYASSPSSVRVRNVPRRIGNWDITAVSVSVDYPDGTTETAACVLTAGVWVGTVPGCETPGDALRGFVVRADGVDENGDPVNGYVLGVGDVEILNRETALTPGVVTFKGDPGPQGERGPAGPQGPQGPKGDPGSGAVESVNGKTGAVVLVGEDIQVGGGDSRLVVEAIHNNESTVYSHIAARNNPHGVTVDQIGAQRKLTAGENITITADGVISASGGGSAVVESEDNPGYAANADYAERAQDAAWASAASSAAYATQAEEAEHAQSADAATAVAWSGVSGKPDSYTPSAHASTHAAVGSDPITPASIGALTKAVADLTYLGLNAGGNVAGMIYANGGLSVPSFSFLYDSFGKSASDAFAPVAQSAYPMASVLGGALKDRTINTATAGGAFTFPARTGNNARDFVLVIGALETAPTVSFPASGVDYVSDDDAVWTAEANKVNAWYFSEIGDSVFMVAHKALAAVSQ